MTLKKALVAITVVAMLFGMVGVATAATPSDIVGTKYQASVNRLMALGVVTGNPDGTYAPASTLTRAQAATIIVRALGLETAAKIATGPTGFKDVSADYWASGYINIATTRGVLKGYPDGNFGPNDKVTYAQYVTMLVRALGYEPLVVGGYPGGYIAKAVSLHLLDGITVPSGGNGEANRGDVALMTDTAVTKVDLVDAVEYSDKVVYQVVPGKRLATSVLGVTENKGWVVYATPDTDDTLSANQFKAYNPNGVGGGTYTVNDGAYDDVKPLLGKIVTFGTKTFTVGITDQTKVVYINPVTTDDKIVSGTVSAAVYTVVTSGSSSWNQLSSIDVKVGSATTATTYFATSSADVVRNFRYGDPADITPGDSVVLTLDDNGKVVFANVKSYSDSNAIVTKVVAADAANNVSQELDYTLPNNTSATVKSGTAFAKNLVVTKDGKRVAFTELAAGDVVRFTSYSGVITSIEAITTKASGTISDVTVNGTTTTLNLGGTSYTLMSGATYKQNATAIEAVIGGSFAAQAAGVTADLKLGFDGKVRFVQLSPVANTATGMLLANAVDSQPYIENGAIVNRGYAKILTTAGETKEFKFADTLTNLGISTLPTMGQIVTISLNSDGFGTAMTAVSSYNVSGSLAAVDTTAKTVTVGTSVYYLSDSTVIFDQTGSSYAAGSISSLAAGQTVNIKTDGGLGVNDIVITKSAPVYGVIVKSYSKTIDAATTTNYLDILTKDGVKTVSLGSGVSGTVYDLVKYQISGGKIAAAGDIVASGQAGTAITAGSLNATTKTFDLSGSTYAVTPNTIIINAHDTTTPDVKLGSFSDLVDSGTTQSSVQIVAAGSGNTPDALVVLVIR